MEQDHQANPLDFLFIINLRVFIDGLDNWEFLNVIGVMFEKLPGNSSISGIINEVLSKFPISSNKKLIDREKHSKRGAIAAWYIFSRSLVYFQLRNCLS